MRNFPHICNESIFLTWAYSIVGLGEPSGILGIVRLSEESIDIGMADAAIPRLTLHDLVGYHEA